MNHYINTPIENEIIEKLNIGDSVLISGTIYVARDAAHKRMQEMLDKKMELPFELKKISYTIWAPLLPEKEDL